MSQWRPLASGLEKQWCSENLFYDEGEKGAHCLYAWLGVPTNSQRLLCTVGMCLSDELWCAKEEYERLTDWLLLVSCFGASLAVFKSVLCSEQSIKLRKKKKKNFFMAQPLRLGSSLRSGHSILQGNLWKSTAKLIWELSMCLKQWSFTQSSVVDLKISSVLVLSCQTHNLLAKSAMQ